MSVLKCPSSSVKSSNRHPQMSNPQVPVLNCRHAKLSKEAFNLGLLDKKKEPSFSGPRQMQSQKAKASLKNRLVRVF
uniref:Uncharacterized protein n=1 Tax=Acrobeloides nanus TaxID=290746 RepID=A0A914DRM5_9BILA